MADNGNSSAGDANTDKTNNANNNGGNNSNDNKGNELTEEQLAKAFEHPRFKELTQAAKELKALKEQKSKEEEAKLKEDQKYKELVEKKDAEIENLKRQGETQVKKQAIITQAIAQGVRKEALDDVVRLVDLSQIQLDDSGNPTNTADIVKTLLTSKKYLLAEPDKVNMGNDNTNDNNTVTGKIWKWSEIQNGSRNNKWYEENKEEIEKAKKEGRIKYNE